MRSILLMISGLLLAGSVQAQFGVRAGLNMATFDNKSLDNSQYASANARIGYQLGVLYEHKLSERLVVVPELQFSRQRTDLKVRDYFYSDASYSATYQLQSSYLHLPILLRGSIGRFYAEAGPQASLQVASHEKGTENIGTIAGAYQVNFDRSATDQYRRFDVGLVAGLGVRLPAGLAVGVRASTGLLSFTTPPQRSRPGYSGELRNQVLQASVSYQFGPRS